MNALIMCKAIRSTVMIYFKIFVILDDFNVLVSVVNMGYKTLLETENNQTDCIKKFHIPILVHYSILPFALMSISEIKQN